MDNEETEENNNDNPVKMEEVNRETIKNTFKKLVWNTYIVKDGQSQICWKCKNVINEENFECGLIKDDSFNEEISTSQFIDNLRPICTICNETIGIQNIKDFDEFMTNFKD